MKLALFAVLLAICCIAFGVSPASIELTTNTPQEYNLLILNTQNVQADLKVEVGGDYAEYFSVGQTTVFLSPGMDRVLVPVRFTPKPGIVPGAHEAHIMVEQLPTELEGNVVAAVPAVRHTIKIRIPAEGKYIDPQIEVLATEAGRPGQIVVNVRNIGTENIQSLTGRVEIRGGNNELVAQETLAAVSLNSTKATNLIAPWTPPAQGPYAIRAVLTYDGVSQTVDSAIDIGNLALEYGDPEFGPYSLGEVVRVDLPVTSQWNRLLPGAKYEVRLNGTERILFTSLASDIPPLGDGTITGYWNTAGTTQGAYDLAFSLIYAGQVDEFVVPVYVGVDEIRVRGAGELTRILLILLVCVVIAGLGYWAYKFINEGQ